MGDVQNTLDLVAGVMADAVNRAMIRKSGLLYIDHGA
jgi:hypothetical protein